MNLSSDFGAAIKAPTLASAVARAIEDDVVARGWPIGAVLGSESDLLARYGVSRAVLREAVRIVEHSGAARMRRGPGGGLVVAEPSRDAVAAAMAVWFSYVGATTVEITEAWGPLAVEAARLAAVRSAPGAADVAARLDALAEDDDVDAGALSAVAGDITDLSGNAALAVFTRALTDLGVARIAADAGESLRTTPEGRRRTLDGYRRVVAAIGEGKDDAAVAGMQAILADIRVRSEAGPAERRPAPRPAGLPPGPGKLAERVALAILADIEVAGWPVGEIVGSESDLIERFGVSRTILREGVRLLEYHGAVRTKRGPRGGLAVAAPDASSVTHAARLILERSSITADDVLAMRSAVEATAARLAATRCTDEDARRLRDLLADERGDDVRTEFQGIHGAIADVARNRPVRLFVDVAAELVTAKLPPSPDLVDIAGEVHHAHERVIEAVIAGDADAAERRMLRHLRAGVALLDTV